jgi:ABC-type molybdate transport system substrate-binding protein
MSPPQADPLGDYTERLFQMIDRLRPGSGAALRAHAVVMDPPPGAPPPKSGDAGADAILDRQVDAAIVYCSGSERYARLLPDAAMVKLPPELRIGPEYGLAVLQDAPQAALLLALTILSPEGQNVLAQHGFQPVTLPGD